MRFKLAVAALILLLFAVLSCSRAPESRPAGTAHKKEPPENLEPIFILPVSTPEPSDIPWTFDIMTFYSKKLPSIFSEIDSLVGRMTAEGLIDERKAQELASKMKQLARKLILDISYNLRVKKVGDVEIAPLTPDIIESEFAKKHGFVLAPEEARLLNRILSSSWAGGKRIIFKLLSPYEIVGAKLVLFPKTGGMEVALGEIAKNKTYEIVFDTKTPFAETKGAVLVLVREGGGEIRVPYGFLTEEAAKVKIIKYAEDYIGVKDLRDILGTSVGR